MSSITSDATLVVSAAVAAVSVALNVYGGLLTERKRADLQLELERAKLVQRQQQDLQSVVARYRGPLLESAIDLESRLWHLCNATNEWLDEEGKLVDEEAIYTVFTIAQFLGFVEVVRRESPREGSFLQPGNPQGTDTLASLVEAFRFVLCASPAYLQDWGNQPDSERDHPGARARRDVAKLAEWRDGVKGLDKELDRADDALRLSRGSQRAIGSAMISTPMGAARHYTLSYSDFHTRLAADAEFAAWLVPLLHDIRRVTSGVRWEGQPAFPFNKWTRVLLLQQLLVETMGLLDSGCVRMPAARRVCLCPVPYAPLPYLTQYQRRMQEISGMTTVGLPEPPAAALLQPLDGSLTVLSPEFVVSKSQFALALPRLVWANGGHGIASGQNGSTADVSNTK